MQKVVTRHDGKAVEIKTDEVTLNAPSVVQLKIAPENVQSFEQRGNDLLLKLQDGRTVVIRDFFVVNDQGERSDLVLEDTAGVLLVGAV